MNNIEFTFEHPLRLLLLIPVVAILLVPFFLMPKRRRYTLKRVTSLCLHVVLAIVLTFVLAGFSVVRHINEQAVVVLMDLSYSTESVQKSMQSHANELLRTIDETTPVAVVAFGEDQVYCVQMDKGDRKLTLQSPGVEATDLEQALTYAASLAPSDKALRIILLTDGKQTDGNAENAAYELANRGIRLDAVYYDTTKIATEEVQIGSFSAPDGVYKNCEAILSAELLSNTECKAVLRLYGNDELLITKEYDIKAGSNMVEMTVLAQNAGVYSYRLELEVPKDTITKNNESYTYLLVAGESTVLIIADTLKEAQPLEAVLSAENKVTTVLARNAPSTLVELCKYDIVVLSNVQYYTLPQGYERILQEYVGGYGRTLLAVGGRDTFMYGDMENTYLQDMLPVTLSLEESSEGNSVALMLVMDCSSSMNNDDRFVLAKQGAIKCLDVMSDNDYVGVISFSKDSKLEAPLVRGDKNNKDMLVRTISELELGRGTYYTEALKLAKEELAKSDADVKHILFLSDGQPVDDGYYPVVEEARNQGITVSTIGLSYSSYILNNIANYGDGRYYYVQSADDLPNIMLSETEQARVSSLIIGDFVPVIQNKSPLTESIADAALPTLGGYLGTTLKENATAYLVTEKAHPLFSVWEYGSGKVACFTSDLNGNWSDRWLADDVGKTLTLNMIRTTVPDVHVESSLVTEVKTYGKTVKISVNTTAESPDNTMTVSVTEGKDSALYTLTQVYPGRFECSIPRKACGVYEMHIVERNAGGDIVDELHTAMAVSYSLEYDGFSKGSEQLLHNLCDLTGGTLFTSMRKLARVTTPGIQTVYDPIVPLSVLLAVCLLLDIAVRKIRWKDLQGCYKKMRDALHKNK